MRELAGRLIQLKFSPLASGGRFRKDNKNRKGAAAEGGRGTHPSKEGISPNPSLLLRKRFDRLPDGLGVGLVSDRHWIEDRHVDTGFAEGGELFLATRGRAYH